MPSPKKSPAVRSRNGQAKHSASRTATGLAKKTRPARRSKKVTFGGGPAPLVRITSVLPASPVVPCTLTVNASCRLGANQVCNAYLMDTSTTPVDVGQSGMPATTQNPQFTFGLTMPGKTYALEVFILDTNSGKVLISDVRDVTTS